MSASECVSVCAVLHVALFFCSFFFTSLFVAACDAVLIFLRERCAALSIWLVRGRGSGNGRGGWAKEWGGGWRHAIGGGDEPLSYYGKFHMQFYRIKQ